VIACTDPRVSPEEFLDMNGEDDNKATIVRTAGGRVHSILSTLLVLSAVGNGGKKGTIMVIHHTDCGLATLTDEQMRRVLMQNKDFPADSDDNSVFEEGVAPAGGKGVMKRRRSVVVRARALSIADQTKEKALRDLNGMKFGSITKGKEGASVKEDVEFLRRCGWFDGMDIWGGVMDTETGIVKEVVGVAEEEKQNGQTSKDDDDDDDDDEDDDESN